MTSGIWPKGVGGAAQAGIKGADDRLDSIQHTVGELVCLDVALGHLEHALVHGIVVLAGGDDQVRPGHQAVAVHLVVVHQVPRAPRPRPRPPGD